MQNSMKGVLLAGAAGIAVSPIVTFSPAANAADLPMKAGPIALPASSWQGFYVGAHAGAAWLTGDSGVGGASGYMTSSTTFIGGGQIGYNWQRGNFVYGLEADISGLSDPKSQGTSYFDYRNSINWLSTFRARAGLAVGDVMAYATGGVAVGGVKNSLTFRDSSGNITSDKSSSRTRVGWAIGGGIEYAWTRNWTTAIEGLFVDFGRYGNAGYLNNGNNSCSRNDICPTSFSNETIIGRFKVNYRF